jgi:REP element-mobilizing transposase RayT
MIKLVREQHHRLPEQLYRGFHVVPFTACLKNKSEFFTRTDLFKTFEGILLSEMSRFESGAEIYLFMPDHFHALLRGESESADVLKAMREFKRKTGFWLSRNYESIHWQKDFYDHILRGNEEVGTHVRYILNNPVRKGLVGSWKEYPFKGSTVHRLDEWDLV